MLRLKLFLKFRNLQAKNKKSKCYKIGISPTKKPDIDNIVKVVLDAMNKFAFKDDTQIVKLEVEKLYTQEEEKIQIQIEEF